jgi:hypothetical protein
VCVARQIGEHGLRTRERQLKFTCEVCRHSQSHVVTHPQRFFDTRYYVTPDDPVGVQAFAVIRDAMRGKGMVALGRLVLAKRERVIALSPMSTGSWARRSFWALKADHVRVDISCSSGARRRRGTTGAPSRKDHRSHHAGEPLHAPVRGGVEDARAPCAGERARSSIQFPSSSLRSDSGSAGL